MTTTTSAVLIAIATWRSRRRETVTMVRGGTSGHVEWDHHGGTTPAIPLTTARVTAGRVLLVIKASTRRCRPLHCWMMRACRWRLHQITATVAASLPVVPLPAAVARMALLPAVGGTHGQHRLASRTGIRPPLVAVRTWTSARVARATNAYPATDRTARSTATPSVGHLTTAATAKHRLGGDRSERGDRCGNRVCRLAGGPPSATTPPL